MAPIRAFTRLSGILCAGMLLATPAFAQTTPPTDEQEAIADLEAQMKELKARIGNVEPGSNRFLVTGYTTAGYGSRQGENRAFSANFNPIFLWKVNDRLFFQAEPEMEIMEGTRETRVNLEFANFAYFVNDYLTVSAGKFLTPFSTFTERYHPDWINRSLTKPLYASEDASLVPYSSLGIQLRGGIPLGNARVRYAFWADEGPSLGTDADQAGAVQWEGYTADSRNNSVKTGGHLWFLPVPSLEIGYARMKGRIGVQGSAFEQVYFTMQEADLTFRKESSALSGIVELRGEWVGSEVTSADYPGAPTFDNRKSGGLAQLSYRPSAVEGDIFRNLEAVVRYDWIKRPEGDPSGLFPQRRWTYNMNFWFTASAVLKVGVERTKTEDPTLGQSYRNGVVAAFSLGF
jgi:hypothetical protein